MSFELKNLVLETSTTTGTGTYTLAGAPAGYNAWSLVGANNYAPYTARMGSTTEYGFGRYLTAPARVERSVVLSNGGAATNWGAGTKEIKLGLPAELLGALVDPNVIGGRLSLDSSDPIPWSDQLARSTIYYHQYLGNHIALWNGACWQPTRFSSVNVAVPASTNQMYDIFGYLSAGALALELLAWTTDAARATGLVKSAEGVLVKSGDQTRRYLGSFRTTGVAGQTEDSGANRLLYNQYNRVTKYLSKLEQTASWTYSTPAWRPLNNSTANRLGVVRGWIDEIVEVRTRLTLGNSTGTGRACGIGIGINTTATPNAAETVEATAVSSAKPYAIYIGTPSMGYTYFQALEYGAGTDTQTWWGGSGLHGWLRS